MARKLAILFLTPGIFALAVFFAGLIYTAYLSLTDLKLAFSPVANFIGLENYVALFRDPIFLKAVAVTLTFVFAAATLELILGVSLAYLVYNSPKPTLYAAVLSLPLLIPTVSLIVYWLAVVDFRSGVVALALSPLGLSMPDFLGSRDLALWAIVGLDVFELTPFVMLIVLAGLFNIPRDIWHAARVDGARGVVKFIKIVAPMALPAIVAAYLLRLIDAFRIFVKVMLLTRGGPGDSTYTTEFYLYTRGVYPLDMGMASAVSIIQIALVVPFIVPYMYLLWRLWR